jgi:hypothetical protein
MRLSLCSIGENVVGRSELGHRRRRSLTRNGPAGWSGAETKGGENGDRPKAGRQP